VPRRRQRHFERARGLLHLTERRSSGGYGRSGATACAARIVFSHINDSRVNPSSALRATDAVAPNLDYPSQSRLPTTDIKPLARSKSRRRRSGAPPYRRHARGGDCFPVLLPLRARNRLWFGPTKHFRVGRYMANRRSINSGTLPQWVYHMAWAACSQLLHFAFALTANTDSVDSAGPCHYAGVLIFWKPGKCLVAQQNSTISGISLFPHFFHQGHGIMFHTIFLRYFTALSRAFVSAVVPTAPRGGRASRVGRHACVASRPPPTRAHAYDPSFKSRAELCRRWRAAFYRENASRPECAVWRAVATF